MDYKQAIEALKQQRAALDATIAAFERLVLTGQSNLTTQKIERRGRKGMDQQEREKVSQRMKKYWASRRKMNSKSADGS